MVRPVTVVRAASRRRSRVARRTAVVACLTMLAAGLALLGGIPAATADDGEAPVPPRILVLGDSLTQGFGGDATWRYWFWREANRQKVLVDLVGPDRGFAAGFGTRYERPNLYFDRDHAARGGASVNDQIAVVDQLMATYQPQVVVVELGANDVLRGDSGETVAAEIEELLGRVWLAAPQARVLLAEIPPHPTRPEASAAGAEANLRLAARFAEDARVVIAHNRTDAALPWVPALHTFDGLHPNAAGQTLLAQHLADAFHRAGLLPQPPAIYRTRSWAPGVVPRLVLSGRVLTIDWSRAMTEVRMSHVLLRIRKRPSTVFRDSPWVSVSRARITRTLAPGSYDVQIVPRRGTMTGVPTARRTIWVR